MRLISGKKLLDDIERAYQVFSQFNFGILAIGITRKAFVISAQAERFSYELYITYRDALIDFIYSSGMTKKELKGDDLYDFLMGYTGEICRNPDNSRHAKFIRKMGSELRKTHQELLKKEQAT